jgi:hypothetical protein
VAQGLINEQRKALIYHDTREWGKDLSPAPTHRQRYSGISVAAVACSVAALVGQGSEPCPHAPPKVLGHECCSCCMLCCSTVAAVACSVAVMLQLCVKRQSDMKHVLSRRQLVHALLQFFCSSDADLQKSVQHLQTELQLLHALLQLCCSSVAALLQLRRPPDAQDTRRASCCFPSIYMRP